VKLSGMIMFILGNYFLSFIQSWNTYICYVLYKDSKPQNFKSSYMKGKNTHNKCGYTSKNSKRSFVIWYHLLQRDGGMPKLEWYIQNIHQWIFSHGSGRPSCVLEYKKEWNVSFHCTARALSLQWCCEVGILPLGKINIHGD